MYTFDFGGIRVVLFAVKISSLEYSNESLLRLSAFQISFKSFSDYTVAGLPYFMRRLANVPNKVYLQELKVHFSVQRFLLR